MNQQKNLLNSRLIKPKYAVPFVLLSLLFASGCGMDAAANPSSVKNPAHGNADPASSTSTGAGAATPPANTSANASQGAEPSEFQIQTMLTDVHLLGDKLGFAWGVTAKELRLYRTDDGGSKWTAVSPKAEGKPFLASPKEKNTIYFFDRDHIWVYRSAQYEEKPAILRTSDGGKTWSSTELPVTARATGMYFTDPSHGWLLTSSDAAMSKSEKSLYQTKDGGASWKRIMGNTGYLPTENPTPEAIPQLGYARGISFKDASNGFVPIESIEGKLKLYGTTDGGVTWGDIVLPSLEEKEGTSYSITAAPEFWGAERMVGWMPVAVRENEAQHYDALHTSDGGKTWSYQPLQTQSTQAGEAALLTFVNDKEGWSLVEGQMSHTADRGATWQALASDPVLAEAIKAFDYPVKMEFRENGTGWLLLKNGDASTASQSRLLQSLDGGKSWKML
ncbi:WD40/YVTN/BNR-like repeat-containing protein [Paenibacillus agricola]|uniref:Sortilin N-terminal domain-containing protein n=1 Tax=Paenibacillus agricola TaxID=2716264 RepID=A0ABX0J605_9BACL|nr:YCF48-related protein [Paenibacillus agricola]NHN30850.1 hypothetical protein [Paenibacillus agricola]